MPTLYYPDRNFIRALSIEQLLADCGREERVFRYIRGLDTFERTFKPGPELPMFDEHLHKEIVATYYDQKRYPVLFTGQSSLDLVERAEEAFITRIVEDYRKIAHNKTVDVVRELETILLLSTEACTCGPD